MDWATLMRAGLHGLRLTPHDFWALTPAELRLMLGAQDGNAPLTRAALATLQQAFPDTTEGQDDAND